MPMAVFGPKREKVTGGWRKYMLRNFIICVAVLLIKSRSLWMGEACGMDGREQRSKQGFGGKHYRKETT
jgi:hypothetical protein